MLDRDEIRPDHVARANADTRTLTFSMGELAALLSATETLTEGAAHEGHPIDGLGVEGQWLLSAYRKINGVMGNAGDGLTFAHGIER